MGPLTHRFFSVVNTILLHDPRLVESMDVELWIQRNCGCRGALQSSTHISDCSECQGPYALCCSRVRCTPLFYLVEREFWWPGHLQMESTHGHPFTLF